MISRLLFLGAVAAALTLSTPAAARAQSSQSSLSGPDLVRGRVIDDKGQVLQGVTVWIDQRHGAVTNQNGEFTIGDLPAGTFLAHTRFLGFAADSVDLTASAGSPVEATVRLTASAQTLRTVRAEGERLTGQALSLNRQRVAENLVSVSTDQEITALPNANAADAFSRLPGVALQRHEGEGAAVQVRGIDGNLTNVTINGAHMSGKSEDNTAGDRRVYLDGIPADLLGAVQLSKTLTPSMDADAIGGSLNIETPSASEEPGLRVQTSYGASDLHAAPVWLGSASYGKQFNRNTAFYFGYSADHNSRVYDDVEPSYDVISMPSGGTTTIPTNTSIREYFTDRQRQGAATRFDWKPTGNTSLSLSGLYSQFLDHGLRYRQDHKLKASSAIPTNALQGTASNMSTTANFQTRRPTDRTEMTGLRGTSLFGANVLDYNFTYSMDQYHWVNGQQLTFTQSGQSGTYDWTNPTYPQITPSGAYTDPTQFGFHQWEVSNENSIGTDYGAAVNYTIPLSAGQYSASLEVGGKLRYEHKTYDNNIIDYNLAPGQTFTMADVLGTFTNSSHYYGHYPIAMSPSLQNWESYRASHPGLMVVDSGSVQAAELASFTGSEQVSSAYAAYSVDVGAAHFLGGVRAEATNTSYHANGQAPTGNGTVPLTGGESYVNVFPNLQMRYELDPETNFRLALTTSMARPLYSALAPAVILNTGVAPTDPNALSAGNPDLKPMTALNEDAMFEHFLRGVGIVSVGVFAKQISHYIYTESFIYQGAPYDGYRGTRPVNAQAGQVEGVEAAWQQRFNFLPGALSGLGIDANGTWTHSHTSTPSRPSMDLPQQAKWMYNLAGTYAKGPVTARVTAQYNGAYIYVLGDGTTDPNSGDTYMMPHTQLDASLNLALDRRVQMVVQGLNLNNEGFAYYTGKPDQYIQREYYGRTATVELRYRM